MYYIYISSNHDLSLNIILEYARFMIMKIKARTEDTTLKPAILDITLLPFFGL